jgi:hypothetical protein
MSAGFGFFRTIWLSIRATNYTTQAFQSAHRNLTDLQKAELQFAKNTMAVGTIYIAFGGIILQTLGKIMSTSALGEMVLSNFGDRVTNSFSRIGDALARILGPILDVVASALDIATTIPFFNEFAAIVLLGGTALIVAAGAAKILGGALTLLNIMHGANAASTVAHQQSLLAWIPTANAATASTLTLGAALKTVGIAAAAGFAVFFALKDVVGVLPAALFGLAAAFAALAVQMWLVAGATSVITLGAAAIAGGAALAGAIAVATSAGSGSEFAMGTRFAPRTMLATIHQGEVIANPMTEKPVEVFSKLNRREPSVTRQEVNFNIEALHTKTDIEDVEQTMARKTYDMFREGR